MSEVWSLTLAISQRTGNLHACASKSALAVEGTQGAASLGILRSVNSMQSLKGRLCSLVQSKSIGSRGAVLPLPNRKRYAEFSYKISRFHAGSDTISGFQSRISRLQRDLISRQISGFSYARFQDFISALRISHAVIYEEKVYEISRSVDPSGGAQTPPLVILRLKWRMIF